MSLTLKDWQEVWCSALIATDTGWCLNLASHTVSICQWVTSPSVPPPVETNGTVVGRVQWMREGGCKGGRLSQTHGIHDILYWALCWRGENHLHHPYKRPGLYKIFCFLLLFSSWAVCCVFHHHGLLGVSRHWAKGLSHQGGSEVRPSNEAL